MSSWLKRLILVGIPDPNKPINVNPAPSDTRPMLNSPLSTEEELQKAYHSKPRYCQMCGKELHYNEVMQYDKMTGKPVVKAIWADCPEEIDPDYHDTWSNITKHDHYLWYNGQWVVAKYPMSSYVGSATTQFTSFGVGTTKG